MKITSRFTVAVHTLLAVYVLGKEYTAGDAVMA